LVNRREAEVKLFQTPVVSVANQPTPPSTQQRTSPTQSKTMQASAVQIASGVGTGIGAFAALDGTAQLIAVGFAGLIVLMAVWIMRERLKKWGEGIR